MKWIILSILIVGCTKSEPQKSDTRSDFEKMGISEVCLNGVVYYYKQYWNNNFQAYALAAKFKGNGSVEICK